MTFYRLNEQGIELFRDYIQTYKSGTPDIFPQELLNSEVYTESIGSNLNTNVLDALNLDDRLSTAKRLCKIVTTLNIKDAEKDVGFWTWCSVYLFNALCKKKNNQFNPGAEACWILMPESYNRYYRHYLASIWFIYNQHKKTPELLEPFMLNRPVNTPGEFFESIASRQEIITNSNLLVLVKNLYWDTEKKKLKRGAGSKDHHKGPPRRLAIVLKQLSRTYDLVSVPIPTLIDILPNEFSSFKPKQIELF